MRAGRWSGVGCENWVDASERGCRRFATWRGFFPFFLWLTLITSMNDVINVTGITGASVIRLPQSFIYARFRSYVRISFNLCSSLFFHLFKVCTSLCRMHIITGPRNWNFQPLRIWCVVGIYVVLESQSTPHVPYCIHRVTNVCLFFEPQNDAGRGSEKIFKRACNFRF